MTVAQADRIEARVMELRNQVALLVRELDRARCLSPAVRADEAHRALCDCAAVWTSRRADYVDKPSAWLHPVAERREFFAA